MGKMVKLGGGKFISSSYPREKYWSFEKLKANHRSEEGEIQ